MKVKLVFHDWCDKSLKSVYATEKGIELSADDFHHGSTFNATIEVDDSEELKKHLQQGFVPVFYMVKTE